MCSADQDSSCVVWLQVEYNISDPCETPLMTRHVRCVMLLSLLVLLVVVRVVLHVLTLCLRRMYAKESGESPRTARTAIWRREEVLLLVVVFIVLCDLVEKFLRNLQEAVIKHQ